jgi:hypothetical protein
MRTGLFLLVAAASLQSLMPSVRTISKGTMSGMDQPQEVVARSAAEWTALWEKHAGRTSPPPAVDFSREIVVGIFLGTRPTAGYGVEIVRATGAKGVLIVEYVEAAPPRGALTAQVLTAPHHLAAVEKHDGEIRFRRVEK